MALTFTTANDAAETGGVKMLVYSDSGLGKTMLTATLPTPILISAESGTLSLKKSNLERLHGVANPSIAYHIPVINIRTLEDLKQANLWCYQAAEAKQFQSIAVDSISEIAEVVLSTAKRAAKDPRQAYGELIDQMEQVVKSFRDLPGKHVYVAAKMEPMKDEASGAIKFGPAMPGAKLGPKLPYYFDEVFCLRTNKDAQGVPFRYLQTQYDLQYVAKDRSGALAAMEPPHLWHCIHKIQS